MAPVFGLSAMPAGQVPYWDTTALPWGPSVAGCPLMIAKAATFGIGVLGTPATAVPGSGLTVIAALTVIVSVTLAQSGGAFRSHN